MQGLAKIFPLSNAIYHTLKIAECIASGLLIFLPKVNLLFSSLGIQVLVLD